MTTIAEALTQYNANLSWHASQASATLALEAIRFLLVNRPVSVGDQGGSMSNESLAAQAEKIERFLGASSPRAFGRSRRVGVAFSDGGLQ